MMKTSKYLTSERREWLKTQNGVPRKEVQRRFKEKYGLDIPYRTLIFHLSKMGVTSPDSHFKKEHTPWNKGINYDEFRSHFSDDEWTEMCGRVLNAPHHRNKIGDVKLIKSKSGLEPWIVYRTGKGLSTYQTLTQLDRFIWEKKVGPIPNDYVVIHLNYNSLDCTMDNLAIIKKKWFFEFTHWMRSMDPEINKTTIKWLTLRDALQERMSNDERRTNKV